MRQHRRAWALTLCSIDLLPHRRCCAVAYSSCCDVLKLYRCDAALQPRACHLRAACACSSGRVQSTRTRRNGIGSVRTAVYGWQTNHPQHMYQIPRAQQSNEYGPHTTHLTDTSLTNNCDAHTPSETIATLPNTTLACVTHADEARRIRRRGGSGNNDDHYHNGSGGPTRPPTEQRCPRHLRAHAAAESVPTRQPP